MKHFTNYEDWLVANSLQRSRLARNNLRDNPYIVAYHFYRRLQVFQDQVLADKFNIKDYWHRFE
jgi:ATP-dependent DNA helicase PIF1